MNEGASKRLTHSATWLASGSVEAVRDQLLAVVDRRGGRVEGVADDRFEASFGSRLAARLGGVVMKASRDRLPMRLRVALTPGQTGAVRVAVDVEDDEGWNAVSVEWRKQPYADAMSGLADELAAGTERASGEARDA